MLTTATDRELGPRPRVALDRHLAGCEPCRAEMTRTEKLLDALAAVPAERPVPPRLAQATLRRVRQLAAEEGECASRLAWWTTTRVSALAFGSVAVVALALGLWGQTGPVPVAPPPAIPRVAKRPAPPAARPTAVAGRERRTPVDPRVPPEPPPELAAAPDLFIDLPILRNLEKLQHFNAIRTTTLDDGQSDG